jgi:hypothetical protein
MDLIDVPAGLHNVAVTDTTVGDVRRATCDVRRARSRSRSRRVLPLSAVQRYRAGADVFVGRGVVPAVFR